MRRRVLGSSLLVVLSIAWAGPAARAGDDVPPAPNAADAKTPPPEKPIPPLASDDEAQAALAAFKPAYRAKGFKGDERTAVRERAMHDLADVQHPGVCDALYRLTKDHDADIRTLAVMYLGAQRALPGYAGPLVVKAIRANAKDAVLVMCGVDALEDLAYRGAVDLLHDLESNKDDMVRKVIILAIGDTVEMRMIDDLLEMAKNVKIDKASKTEGHEVHYDSGAAGDADQKAAEKMYHDKYGKSAHKARSAGRASRDIGPIILEALKHLTGQDFESGQAAKAWAEKHADEISARKKALDDVEKQQAEAAAALR